MMILAGCGLKGDPVPPMRVTSDAQGVLEISAKAVSKSVMLSWRFQNADGRISHIDIEKSELGTRGNLCPECPRTFEKIGQVPVQKQPQYQFTDSEVDPGIVYSYRLKLCNGAGVCRESSVVDIELK
jgi:hypothetical protein